MIIIINIYSANTVKFSALYKVGLPLQSAFTLRVCF